MLWQLYVVTIEVMTVEREPVRGWMTHPAFDAQHASSTAAVVLARRFQEWRICSVELHPGQYN